MSLNVFPFAVRPIGFSEPELAAFDAQFAAGRGKGYGYLRLEDENLQDPDFYVANAASLKALVKLVDLGPTEVRPALLVGSPLAELPYPQVAHPIDWERFFEALDGLVETRADALARLQASDVVTVPERRRGGRLDLDLSDPARYRRMRATVPADGAVLMVDRSSASRDYLADLLARQQIPVLWAGDEETAYRICKEQRVAVVMVNTSTPEVDPYRLCWAIKEKDSPLRTVVIFLVSKPFVYDVQQANYVGADGFLNKPLASHHLINVLKKFLPFPR